MSLMLVRAFLAPLASPSNSSNGNEPTKSIQNHFYGRVTYEGKTSISISMNTEDGNSSASGNQATPREGREIVDSPSTYTEYITSNLEVISPNSSWIKHDEPISHETSAKV